MRGLSPLPRLAPSLLRCVNPVFTATELAAPTLHRNVCSRQRSRPMQPPACLPSPPQAAPRCGWPTTWRTATSSTTRSRCTSSTRERGCTARVYSQDVRCARANVARSCAALSSPRCTLSHRRHRPGARPLILLSRAWRLAQRGEGGGHAAGPAGPASVDPWNHPPGPGPAPPSPPPPRAAPLRRASQSWQRSTRYHTSSATTSLPAWDTGGRTTGAGRAGGTSCHGCWGPASGDAPRVAARAQCSLRLPCYPNAQGGGSVLGAASAAALQVQGAHTGSWGRPHSVRTPGHCTSPPIDP